MARVQKLLPNLSISSLKAEFYVGNVTVNGQRAMVNKLQEAIDDGILTARIEESAQLFHNGDIQSAVRAMKACLASYKVNMPKAIAAGSPMDVVAENRRIETLQAFLKVQGGTRRKANTFDSSRAVYDVTNEEIESMDGNIQLLKSTYECMASKMSKDLSHLSPGEDNYAEKCALRDRLNMQFPRVAELYAAAKAAARLSLNDAAGPLVEKLTKNKATMLSKAEVELLQKLLANK